jgi:hypothetical protein
VAAPKAAQNGADGEVPPPPPGRYTSIDGEEASPEGDHNAGPGARRTPPPRRGGKQQPFKAPASPEEAFGDIPGMEDAMAKFRSGQERVERIKAKLAAEGLDTSALDMNVAGMDGLDDEALERFLRALAGGKMDFNSKKPGGPPGGKGGPGGRRPPRRGPKGRPGAEPAPAGDKTEL